MSGIKETYIQVTRNLLLFLNLIATFLPSSILAFILFLWTIFFKQAVTAMVQQAMQYIDKTPDLDTRIELIKTLNNVSAGKVSRS